MSSSETKLTFFRQSGWMVIAATLSGVFMFGVHLFNRWMPPGGYGGFGAALALMTYLQFPVVGLQQTVAQQGAAALTEEDQRRLTYTARRLLLWTFLLWLGLVGAAWLGLRPFMDAFKIEATSDVGVLLILALVNFWTPIFQGLLQGSQNFLWMGWASMLSGAGRFAAIGVLVAGLGLQSTGIMVGILAGAVIPLGISIWHTRTIWLGPEERMSLRSLLQNLSPLTIGLAASQILFITDILIARGFPKDLTDQYNALATVGRALVTFSAPVIAVMFPKIVNSSARAEKSNAFVLALGVTALLAGGAALGLTLFIKPIFQVVFPTKMGLVGLIPLYAWCILPQAIGNVLLSDLLARRRFAVIVPSMGLAIAYVVALRIYNDAPTSLIKTMGVASFAFFLITAAFTWWDLKRGKPGRESHD